MPRAKRVTREQNADSVGVASKLKNHKPLKNNRFLKLARAMLYLWYKNKKTHAAPNKNKTHGSGITRTNAAEAQLTDFFGEDTFFRGSPRSRTQNNKTVPRQPQYRLDRQRWKQLSAQKNTFALDPAWRSHKTAVKGHDHQKQQQVAPQ
jgi:hypothetical protein